VRNSPVFSITEGCERGFSVVVDANRRPERTLEVLHLVPSFVSNTKAAHDLLFHSSCAVMVAPALALHVAEERKNATKSWRRKEMVRVKRRISLYDLPFPSWQQR